MEIISRRKLLPGDPQCGCEWAVSCINCNGCACCYAGIECEHPNHPNKYFGETLIQEFFCPDCSFDVKQPDIGDSAWCHKCVDVETKVVDGSASSSGNVDVEADTFEKNKSVFQ